MSNISTSFITFINIFMIPVLGVRVYVYRHGIKWENSSEIRFIYLLLCVLNLPFGAVLANFVQKIFLVVCNVERIKYTCVGILSIVMLVFILEIVEKYIKIHVSISLRKSSVNKKSKVQKESINEK